MLVTKELLLLIYINLDKDILEEYGWMTKIYWLFFISWLAILVDEAPIRAELLKKAFSAYQY